jgi:hypothetical protein
MSVSWKTLLAAGPAVALVAALLLMPLPSSWEGDWQSKFFDLGHVPLFAALTLYLWLVLGRSLLWPVLIALALAGVAELVQNRFGRTGNLLDFVRGALGIAAAVVALHFWRGPRTLPRLAVHTLAVMALVAWPVADAGPWLLDAWEGARAFPTLADFATDRQLLRWSTHQGELRRVPDPQQASGFSARIELLPGPEAYSAAGMNPIVRDWRGQRRVGFSFTVVGEPLLLVFSVRARDAAGRSSNYQDPNEKTYPPGDHTVRIDLEHAAPRAQPGPLNLADVRRVVIFTYAPGRTRTITIHRIWLE